MENNTTTPTTTPRAATLSPHAPPPPPHLRLLCSYNGHILPRPHDKTLTYMGGNTRLITLPLPTTLQTLIHKIIQTTSFNATSSFLIKYQLPYEDLDSLVSVSTDEDLHNMIDEYFLYNLNNNENNNKMKLFLFPRNSDSVLMESVKSLGSVLLEGGEKSDEVFVKGLNGGLGLGSCFLSFSEGNNSLLGLDDDDDVIKVKLDDDVIKVNSEEKKVVVQDVQSVPSESPKFGSVPDSPVKVKEEVNYVAVQAPVKVVNGEVKEEVTYVAVPAPVKVFNSEFKEEMNYGAVQAPLKVVNGGEVKEEVNYAAVQAPLKVNNGEVKEEVNYVAVQSPMKVKEEVNYVAVQAPMLPANGLGGNGLGHRVSSGFGFDMASPDSVLSDGSLTNPLSRRNPPVIYQDAATQTQYPNSNNNGVTNDQNARNQMQQQRIYAATQTQYSNNNIYGVTDDQNTRIQMQQQQIHDSAYLRSTSTSAVTTTTTAQTDLQHSQAHQQHQFIHTTDPSSFIDQNTRAHLQQQEIHDSAYLTSTAATKTDLGHPQVHQQHQVIHLQQQEIHDSAYLTSTAATSTTAATKTDLEHPEVHQQHQFIHLQQQQIHDSAYLTSTNAATKTDLQHPQVHQQHQFIHTAVPPPPQYIHHHPSGAVPMASYYPIYRPQSQHHVPLSALDQRQIVYYVPVIAAPPNSQVPNPTSLFTTPRTVQPTSKPESPVYRTNSSGPQSVQVPSSQHQHQPQPQYVAYSHIQQPSQAIASSGGSGGNYAYDFADLSQQGQCMYYAAQPMPPQSSAQYQTTSSTLPVEVGSRIQTENKPSQAVASSGGSGGNYAYEFADQSQQGQRAYYAAQPMPPQSSAQYQTMSSTLPVEGGSHIQTENSMKQQVKTSQP